MTPLFESVPPQNLPPELQWHIPENQKDHLGKSLILAGKPVTLHTHRVGRRTWPCINQWPKLGWECPHCERSRRSTTWVPVVTCNRPFQKLVLMGGETTWKSVKDFPAGIIVEAHLAKTLRPTVMFVKSSLPIGAKLLSDAASELTLGGGDITRWLLHYWQWSELTKRYGQVFRESLKTRSVRERSETHGMELFTDTGRAVG